MIHEQRIDPFRIFYELLRIINFTFQILVGLEKQNLYNFFL